MVYVCAKLHNFSSLRGRDPTGGGIPRYLFTLHRTPGCNTFRHPSRYSTVRSGTLWHALAHKGKWSTIARFQTDSARIRFAFRCILAPLLAQCFMGTARVWHLNTPLDPKPCSQAEFTFFGTVYGKASGRSVLNA